MTISCRKAALALLVVGQVAALTACGPDYLADEVKKFSVAANTGNTAVQKAAGAFAATEGKLTMASVANAGQPLSFNPVACRQAVSVENCRVTVGPSRQPLLPSNDDKPIPAQYFAMIAQYSELLTKLLGAKTTDDLNGLQKQVGAAIKGIDSLSAGFSASPGGIIAGGASEVIFAIAQSIDDAVRLAHVRRSILAAEAPVRTATDFVTRPQGNGPSLMAEFQRTIVDGAVTDLNNRVRTYNVIPRTDAFSADRRTALEAIAAAQTGTAELQGVTLAQLAQDTLAAHDELVRSARENRLTAKELMSAIEALYQRADTIRKAIDKILGA
jgi:hypothetical protein